MLVDPNALDPTGGTSMNWFKPSADGKLVAVSLSKGGDEVGDVTSSTSPRASRSGEVIPRVNTGTAGGDLAWTPDGTGFYYTRYPREGERPAEDMNFYQQVYFHELGTPTADDRYELGKDSPRIAETELKIDRRTGRVLATMQNGDGGEFAHYLREPDGKWRQFSKFEDKIIQAEFGPNDDLFVVSRKDAPRGKILRVPIDDARRGRRPRWSCPRARTRSSPSFWQSREARSSSTDSRLYVVYQLGGPSEIRVFDLDGQAAAGAAAAAGGVGGRSDAARRATTCCSRWARTSSRPRCTATTPRPARSTQTALTHRRAGESRRRRGGARVRRRRRTARRCR